MANLHCLASTLYIPFSKLKIQMKLLLLFSLIRQDCKMTSNSNRFDDFFTNMPTLESQYLYNSDRRSFGTRNDA